MNIEELGIFYVLADYGILGLAVIALGYIGWYLFKKNMEEKDKMQQRIEELEKNNK